NARKLDTLLDEHAAMPTLVHCASGNRVGALMALRAAWVQGKSKEEALAIGRRWGLTKAEAAIDKRLSQSRGRFYPRAHHRRHDAAGLSRTRSHPYVSGD